MEDRVVLALDFGGTKIAAAAADLTGRRLATDTAATRPERGARSNLARGLELARGLTGGDVAAICACTFGIPGPDGVELATAVDGWSDLALARELEDAFPGAAARVATDVKAATLAELRFGALRDCDPALYLNLGTGLAVGIVCGGSVVAGANGAAGEIGYALRSVADLGRADAEVLEAAVSGTALATTADASDAATVFARAAGDARLAAALDEFLAELAFQLVNLTVALDPARIAVGGGMVGSWRAIEPTLRTALERHVPFPPQLVPGAFPFDATLVGGIALALEAVDERTAFDLEVAPR